MIRQFVDCLGKDVVRNKRLLKITTEKDWILYKHL